MPVLQGQYVQLNYYPCQKGDALERLLQKRMSSRWISWYGADLDLRMTVLILISPLCVNPKKKSQVWLLPGS